MKYNKEHIAQLLRRFMDGETSEEEEKILEEYFSHDDGIPEEWAAYCEMFASFSTDAYDFSEEEKQSFIKEPKKLRARMSWLWLVAACIAALIIVLLPPPREKKGQVAKRDDTVIQRTKDEKRDKTEEHLQSAEEEQVGQTATEKLFTAECASAPAMEEIATDSLQTIYSCSQPSEDEGKGVMQASTASQDPGLVMEFVSKLADTFEAEKVWLDCTKSSGKSSSTTMVYVFKENVDVKGRLLQVACWYDNALPGHHLMLNSQQMLFELQEVSKRKQYLWLVEKVGSKTLLVASQADIGARIIPPCYNDFKREIKDNYSL